MVCSQPAGSERNKAVLWGLPPVALCTLATLTTGEVSQATTAPAEAFPIPSHNVIPGEDGSGVVVPAIAPPEQQLAQQFSAPTAEGAIAPGNSLTTGGVVSADASVGYYQDYQPVPIPAAPSVPVGSSLPPGQAKSMPADSPVAPGEGRVMSTNPPAPPMPVETVETASISDPMWALPPGSAIGSDTLTQRTPPPAPPSRTPAPSPIPLQLDDPNLVVTVTDVQVVGATEDLQQSVLRTVRSQPGGSTSQQQLREDVTAILNTGLFSSASASLRNAPPGVAVTFQVEPIVVQSVQLSGAQALTPEVATDLLSPQIGAPVSLTLLDQGVRRINEWYTQNGYTLARVLTVRPNRSGVVTIEVAEGLVGEIRLRFTDRNGRQVDDQGRPVQSRTQESFIREQIQLRPGQVFREDVARQDLQRIARLGLFERVNLAFEGDARRVDVIYDLTETPARAVNFGAGYSNDNGLFGTVSYRDDNVGGVGQQLGTFVQIGQRVFQFDGRFTNPYRETAPDRLGYSANVFQRGFVSPTFDEEIRLPNGDRVRENKLGGGFSVMRPISPGWMGSLGLNYTRTSLRDRDGTVARRDELGNPLSFSGTGIDDLVTVGFSARRDLRDNPANPTNGSLLVLSTEQSIPIGLGNILNNRLQANYVQYVPVNLLYSADDPRPQEVFAFNLQGGTVIGDLPPYNAFNLGGANSVRGYGSNDVASGRSYFLASAEYRFPLFNPVGGVVFADFATDLGTGDDVPGEPALDRGKPGSGFGAGLGLRIQSPLGIIRADLGFNDQGESRLQFGFGQKF